LLQKFIIFLPRLLALQPGGVLNYLKNIENDSIIPVRKILGRGAAILLAD
jgi:hypothetical protein